LGREATFDLAIKTVGQMREREGRGARKIFNPILFLRKFILDILLLV